MTNRDRLGSISRVVLIAAFFIYLTGKVSCGKGSENLPLNDPNAMIKMVLATLRGSPSLASGRGTALIKLNNVPTFPEDKGFYADFVFKGEKTRTDLYQLQGTEKGPRISARALTEKNYIWVLPRNASVQHPRGAIPDFESLYLHPRAFRYFNSKDLERRLEALLIPSTDSQVSAELDEAGILNIRLQTKPSNGTHNFSISFDTRIGMRPVLFTLTFGFNDPSKPNKTFTQKLQWAQYGSEWYVSHAVYEAHLLTPVDPNIQEQDFGDNSIEYTLQEFSPNVAVSDEEFTLQGMNVPKGVSVADLIAGVNYRYGTEVHKIGDLEKALQEANFPTQIRQQQSDATVRTEDSNTQKPLARPNRLANMSSGEDKSIPSLAQTSRHRGWVLPVLIASIVSIVLIVGFLGYKRTGRRSKPGE